MPRTPGSEFIVVLAALAVLPDCPWAADCLWAHGDDHRLHYDFSIAFNKQPRCMVQGQLDGKNYLFYDCENDKVISMDFLREEVMGTDAWKDQTKTLRDMGDLIRQHLSDIEPEKYADGAPLALQVSLICQCTAGGRTKGSWEFFSDGQRLLVFDAESGEYRANNSRGEQMKDEWERDDDLTKAFNFYSTRDCQGWLQFLVPRKKELETTAAPTTATATATAPAPAPSKATTNTHITLIVSVILTCLVIVGW